MSDQRATNRAYSRKMAWIQYKSPGPISTGRVVLGEKLLLFVSGLALMCISVPTSAFAHPQSPSLTTQKAPPKFEVASVKESAPGNSHTGLHVSRDRVTVQNMSLKQIIQYAFDVKTDAQIAGGPNWISSKRYDIVGTKDASESGHQGNPPDEEDSARIMLRSLLAERFHLQVSKQMRQLPVYELVTDRHGPDLMSKLNAKDAKADENKKPAGISINNGVLTAQAVTLKSFADVLTRQPEVGNRPVLDKTGLSGEYSFNLKWTPRYGASAESDGSSTAPGNDTLSLFTALQEQLGLKLKAAKGLSQVVVIDSVQEPTPN